MALQIRRGTNAERLTITPSEGELIYTTDSKRVFVGDGSTAGGNDISAGIESLLEDSSPQLGGSLDLNGNSIIGTGNISIDGTITATGNINLGDDGGDNVGILGSLTTSLNPLVDSAIDVGSPTKRWRNGYFSGLTVDGQIDAISFNGLVIANDSTISYNPADGIFAGDVTGDLTGDVTGDVTGNVTGNLTGDVTGNLIGNVTGNLIGNVTGTVTGEVNGSIFADDSSLIIDGIQNAVFTNNITVSNITDANILKTNILNDQNSSGILEIDMTNTGGNSQPRVEVKSNGASGSGLWVMTEDTTRTLAGTDNIGRLLFRAIDQAGTHTPVVAIARKDEFIIAVGSKNTAETFHIATATGNYGLGIEPNADAKVNVGGAMLLGNMDTTTRDALTPANGMIIYNTTDNKFQGYENGAWANLI